MIQPDLCHCGGLWEAKKIAAMAEVYTMGVAPHNPLGPVANAAALHFDLSTPNFLIQEHFDPFNDPWTKDLVTWVPGIDAANGHMSLPTAPGLGIDINIEVAREHPYDPHAYLNVNKPGWEMRLGADGAKRARQTASVER